ncbi:choline dehydrogenase [Diaphorobacter sp. HDW4A]|uniref:GMC family oxidoreductase n=1 Tax=Diaphorobacter sp. HDW4A TaxID=2714924 RepID=UPI00140872C3|nr:GMC family oxidoreductase N-terminal domain-containing protein [Diaphorobacter sp. HDW4A]QIL79295.1 choline dehydrogenase [Diaphorobacter sp. HDW4A]
MTAQVFDYVIVGAGSAGCVLANRLTQDRDVTVCLLEAGPRDWSPYIHIPAGFIKTFENSPVNWGYRQEPSESTAGRVLLAPRGKTLGGSSSINGHIYNRGQPLDFDRWAEMGNTSWSYSELLPHFKRMEQRIGEGDPAFRGRDGELTVTDLDQHHPLCDAFIQGAQSLGIPRNGDYNGATAEGISYAQRTIRNGRRVSAATAFLHPAKGRSNLVVRTHAHVTRLMLHEGRATGVQYQQGGATGQALEVKARREVIVSSGAYNSPQLLELSGIGDPKVLRAQGIEVRHALPGVGNGLQDHYAPRTVARVKNMRTINEISRGPRLALEIAKWFTHRKGILALSPTLVYGTWHSGVTPEPCDLQFTFTPASYNEGVIGRLADTPGMTVAAWQQRPQSRGSVHIKANDPYRAPRIHHNYLATELDQKVTIAGMRLSRQLLDTEALRPYFDHEEFPGKQIQSDDEFLDAARRKGNSTYHPACSCAMGPRNQAGSVVDERLKVHGIESLRVVDASIMPSMISGNLNAVVMAIADKAADMIMKP